MQSRLWDIEIGLLIRDLRKFTAMLAELREFKEAQPGKKEEFEARLARLEADKDSQAADLTGSRKNSKTPAESSRASPPTSAGSRASPPSPKKG